MDWKKGEKHMNGIKTIQIPVTTKDHTLHTRMKTKHGLTWPEYLNIARETLEKRGR